MNLKLLSIVVTTSTLSMLLYTPLALAKGRKPKVPDKFPPSPLEIKIPDPMIPPTVKAQPLSNQEKQTLALGLDKLNQQALAKLESGDKQGAFDIWNRELRLRRYLGILPEIQALSRVGEIAWKQNNSLQVRYITQRLKNIQKQTQKQNQKQNQQLEANLEILQALGNAFIKVRAPKSSLEAYNKILERVKQQNNGEAEIATLTTIADIHMTWFDYTQAAKVYEELLSLVPNRNVSSNQQIYSEELAYIYTQTKQNQKSIDIREKLVNIYRQGNNVVKIPALKLAIGSNYEFLAKGDINLLEAAFQSYQEAYTLAWELKQYVRAGEALEKLITLYSSQGQTEEALQASKILLQTQQKASNLYGVMRAYDKIGNINLQRQNYPQALTAFQQGLDLAKQLQYEQEYFVEQVNKLSGKVSN